MPENRCVCHHIQPNVSAMCGTAVISHGSCQMIVEHKLSRSSLQRCALKTFCLVSFCFVILVCLLLNQHKQGAAGINYLVSLHPPVQHLHLIVVRLVELTGWSQPGILVGLSRSHKFIKAMTEMRFKWDAESNLGLLIKLLWFIGWKNALFEFEMKRTHTASTWNICQMQR